MKQCCCICSLSSWATLLSLSSLLHSASAVSSCFGIGTHTGTTLSPTVSASLSVSDWLMPEKSEDAKEETSETAWLRPRVSVDQPSTCNGPSKPGMDIDRLSPALEV